MNHQELITRLRSGAVIALEQLAFGGVATFADEAADMIEAAIAERDALRQQLAEAHALIEASRKQEHVAYSYALASAWAAEEVKLYTAPVVADDVLKAAQDILRKEAMSNLKQEIRSALHFSIQVLENSKAVGGAND